MIIRKRFHQVKITNPFLLNKNDGSINYKTAEKTRFTTNYRTAEEGLFHINYKIVEEGSIYN